MSFDDDASDLEERQREAAISTRRPSGPEPCGECHNCGEPVGDGMRFCPGPDCRDDYEARQRARAMRARDGE